VVQVRWLLLNGSLQQQVAHLPQACSGNLWSKGSSGMKARQWTVCLPSYDCPARRDCWQRRSPSPSALSTWACPTEGSAAYLAPTQLAMCSGLQAFPPFEGPSGEELSTQWAALHNSECAVWQPEVGTPQGWPIQPGHHRWGPERVRPAFCRGTRQCPACLPRSRHRDSQTRKFPTTQLSMLPRLSRAGYPTAGATS
jgi:hypothetical protein